MAREPGIEAALWYQTAPAAEATPPLDGDRRADVAVVGAGFTGCSAALHLARQGVDVVVLEAGEVGSGASGRNAGLVNAGLWLDPDVVERRLGPEHGPRFIAAFGGNTKLVFDLVQRYAIDCDLDRKPVIRGAHSRWAMRGLESHARQWTARGAPLELVDRARAAELLGTERYVGALIDHRSSAIQPLSYVRGLARAAQGEGAALHTRSPVTGLAPGAGGWRVATARGTVHADKVILATNAYSDRLWPGIRAGIIPIGCFAYATEPLSENVRRTVLPAGHALYDTQPAMYFARVDREGRLVLGSLGYLPVGDEHKAGSWANRAGRWLFPQLGDLRWTGKWAGTIGFTPDHLPRLHAPAPGLHMALGYNGRGIAPGTLWGKVLAEWVMGAPESELPLPVTPLRAAPFRRTWQFFYEGAFRAYRLARLFDQSPIQLRRTRRSVR